MCDVGVVPLGHMIPNMWPSCTIAKSCMEAIWNWNCRYYVGKAWQNQRLEGLKFPSLISLLIFPKEIIALGFFQGLHLTVRITGVLFSLQWGNGNHSMNQWLITINQPFMARILTMEYTSDAFVIDLQGWVGFFVLNGGKKKKSPAKNVLSIFK